jgi:hypothetical protein
MRYLTLLLLIISLNGFSQKLLDFGEITADSGFCKKPKNKTFSNTHYRIYDICNSKHQLEIHFEATTFLLYSYHLIKITYDTISGWEAFTSIPFKEDSLKKIIIKKDFEKILDTLKENGIFTLPDQQDLKLKGSVDDGIEYSVTFKANNKFRTYNYNNPEIMLDMNEGNHELEQFIRIIHLFKNIKNTNDR